MKSEYEFRSLALEAISLLQSTASLALGPKIQDQIRSQGSVSGILLKE